MSNYQFTFLRQAKQQLVDLKIIYIISILVQSMKLYNHFLKHISFYVVVQSKLKLHTNF